MRRLRRLPEYARHPLRLADRVPMARRAVPFARLAIRGIDYTRVNGLRAATLRAASSVQIRLDATRLAKTSPISEIAVETLKEVRLLRSLKALENVIDYYARAALPVNLPSAPLALIRDILQRNGFSDGVGELSVQSALLSLSEANPNCSDIWLELGHLRFDQKRFEEALACYRKATETRALPATSTDWALNPTIQARVALAHLLLARGERAAAFHEYEVLAAIAPNQTTARVEFGLMLRESNQIQRMLYVFLSATQYEWPRWQVPDGGRDASKIRFRRIQNSTRGSDPRGGRIAFPCSSQYLRG